MKFEWKEIGAWTYRVKILGGWLVSVGNGVCFVPDPKHKWKVEK